MGCAEWIVFALVALGKTGKPATLAQRANTIAPAGQDLMRVSLVAHVPDQAVIRCIENVMKSDGQFDYTQARTQMAAGNRNRVDGLLAQLIGELTQLRFRQGTQIGR
jgi:hypothetical protein